jgi:hypothetical protein
MPTEVVSLGNGHDHHDNYLEVSAKQDIYSLGRTIDWLLDHSSLGYVHHKATYPSSFRIHAACLQRSSSNRCTRLPHRKQEDQPIRKLTKKMQQVQVEQRPTAEQAQQLFQEFVYHADGPANSP